MATLYLAQQTKLFTETWQAPVDGTPISQKGVRKWGQFRSRN